MRIYYLVSIIFLQQLWADTCHKKLGKLGDTQGKFVYCATTKAVPVQLCNGCEPEFTEMVVSYGSLVEDKNCSKELFDQDRINIISTTQSILVGLWTKAYCDDCFTGNHSSVFDVKSIALNDCLKNNVGNECFACMKDYMDLNNYYKELDQHNNAKVCFDLQDQMNTTRKHWSKDLHCCKREFKMTLFLSISSLMLALPVIFYVSLYAYGKRREQNRGVLNSEDAETTSSVPNSSSSTLPVESETGASSSNNTKHNFKNRNKTQSKGVTTDNSSEESDDDLRKKR